MLVNTEEFNQIFFNLINVYYSVGTGEEASISYFLWYNLIIWSFNYIFDSPMQCFQWNILQYIRTLKWMWHEIKKKLFNWL